VLYTLRIRKELTG